MSSSTSIVLMEVVVLEIVDMAFSLTTLKQYNL